MYKGFIAAIICSLMIFDGNASSFNIAGTVETITIISTADIHANIDGYDYNKGIYFPVGLNRVSTIVNREREIDKDVILIDAGDFNRGNPMVDIYNTIKNDEPNPMVKLMNEMEYDIAVVGNHELDYGIKIVNKLKSETNFPLISANIYHDGKLLFKPYQIVYKKGVKIGIVGFTTQSAIRYNSGDDIDDIEIKDIKKEAEKYIEILRDKEKADVVVAVVHSGIDGSFNAPDDEKDALELTKLQEKPDVIISGHSHKIIPRMEVNGVIIQSPGAMGLGAGKIQLSLNKTGEKWRITDSNASFIPSLFKKIDSKIQEQAQVYTSNAKVIVNSKLGKVENYDGGQLLNIVKQKSANADMVLNEKITYPLYIKDSMTLNDLYKLYGSENYIVGIKTKGKYIKRFIDLTLKEPSDGYDRLYPLKIYRENGEVLFYSNNKLINDEDEISLALTGRQLRFDKNIKKSGIASGEQYYNSFQSYGFQGRVRQQIQNFIQKGEM